MYIYIYIYTHVTSFKRRAEQLFSKGCTNNNMRLLDMTKFCLALFPHTLKNIVTFVSTSNFSAGGGVTPPSPREQPYDCGGLTGRALTSTGGGYPPPSCDWGGLTGVTQKTTTADDDVGGYPPPARYEQK